MKKKLKTIEQIKRENPEWYTNSGHICFKGLAIIIHEYMFKYFGKEIEVKEEEEGDGYTYKDWSFLKKWFEPDFEPIELVKGWAWWIKSKYLKKENTMQNKYYMLENEFSTEELEAEVERRKRLNSKPVILENPDLDELKDICQGIINDIATGKWPEDNDDAQYVYEAAMKGLFGENIFQWINKNT